jgi:RNA 3'-terminal phosphate cyclase (ATP)
MERALKTRGWNLGPRTRGHVAIRIHPVRRGQTIKFTAPPRYTVPESYQVQKIDVSIVVPGSSHAQVQDDFARSLGELYPDADVEFTVVHDSGHDARWYLMLVAHSSGGGIRWARDALFSMPKKIKSSREKFIQQACRNLCKELFEETSLGGTVDEFLQDQLVFIQALAEGYSSFVRDADGTVDGLVDGMGGLAVGVGEGVRMRREKTHEPFGSGSTHTTTARWVVSEMLPRAEFYNKGDVVKGVGFCLR